MNALPKNALRLLEIETITLKSIGIDEPVSAQPAQSSKKSVIKGLFKKKSGDAPSKVKNMSDLHKRNYQFEVAAWLRFGLSSSERNLSLCLLFKDAKGERVVIVEEQRIEDGASSMLSGTAEIETRGPLLGLKLACAGLKEEDRCYVEETVLNRQVEQELAAVGA